VFKKIIASLCLVLSIWSFGFSQENSKIIVGKNYFGNTINEHEICDMVAFTSRPDVSKAIANIVRRSGLKQNFYVMECPNTDNCFAATRSGERLIVYDPSFMKKINNATKTDWAALSILAHEIGHHLQGHTIKPGGSEHEKELEADEFSGFVMYQMGANIKEAQSAIFSLTSDYATSTHPPRGKRLRSIETGYYNAKELYPDLNNKPVSHDIAVVEEPKSNKLNDEIIIEELKVEPRAEPVIRTRGCVNGNCSDGFGTAINSKTNEKFEGNWRLGKRHGFGKEFYFNNTKKFEGNFNNGLYHGQGTLYLKNGDRYSGNFIHGKMHGSASSYYYKNGDRIIVDFINGKKHGKARMIYWGGTEGTKYFNNDIEL
jgi:antitoxin component YwqK of YwqJK toxin-antitoxin module